MGFCLCRASPSLLCRVQLSTHSSHPAPPRHHQHRPLLPCFFPPHWLLFPSFLCCFILTPSQDPMMLENLKAQSLGCFLLLIHAHFPGALIQFHVFKHYCLCLYIPGMYVDLYPSLCSRGPDSYLHSHLHTHLHSQHLYSFKMSESKFLL